MILMGSEGGGGSGGLTVADLQVANTVYVAKNGNDANTGSISDPFLTVEAANDHAISLVNPVVDWDELVVVKVSPGKYTEHITNAHVRVVIVGDPQIDPDHWSDGVILYNTGADAAHYPIDIPGRLQLVGITVSVDSGGVFGQLPERFIATSCAFYGGHFLERLDRSCNIYCNFCYINCSFFNLTGVVDFDRFFALRYCDVQSSDPMILGTTGTSFRKILKLEGTKVDLPLQISGIWSLTSQNSELYTNGSITFDTDGVIDVYNTIIVNGIHFVKDTSEYKRFVGNYFKATTPGQTDITVEPGVTISIVDYSGNKQENGLPAAFQIAGGGRNVGAFAENKYCSLACAIESIPAGESGIIEIYEDQTALDPFVLNTGSKVTIRGGKRYNLEFTGDIVTLGANQEISFHEIAHLSGQKMEIAGNAAYLGFENCLTVQGYLVATSGTDSMILSYFSSLLGVTGFPVLAIDNADTLIVSGYSRIKSASGQPAVQFNVLTVNKLKAKYSTFLHGDFGTNRPIVYTGATGKVDVAVYNSAMNASLDTADFNNTIGSPNLTVSAEIDF